MEVLLVMFKSDGARRDFRVTKNRMVIGRKTDCDLRIPLSSVSRHHCELKVDPDAEEVELRDLGSSNGTYHNNVRVQEAIVSPGDEIMVGPVVFTVVIDGQPEQIEPVRTVLENDNKADTRVTQTPDDAAVAALNADDSGDDLPAVDADDESHSPTIDLDEDPIEALQRMADAESSNDDDDLYPGLDDSDVPDRSG